MATYNSFKRIDSESIVDNSLSTADIGAGQITSQKFAPGAITDIKILNGAVTTGKLDPTLDISTKTVIYRPILNADINNGVIAGSKLASGAATANLGYTPVNVAGDVMSGALIVQNGSIIGGDDADSGFKVTADDIQLSLNGGTKLQFNSSGHSVEADRPAWQASGNGGWYYANSYGGTGGWRELTMPWNYQTNGGITTSGGGSCRVTVPIAGYYYMYLQSYWYNDANNTNGYTHWNIGKNGGTGQLNTGRTPHTMFAHGVPNNHAPGVMTGMLLYMNAGQFISPQPYFGGNQGRHHGDHSLWCGYLVG